MNEIEHGQIVITVDTYPLAGQRRLSPEILISTVDEFMREQGVTYRIKFETRRVKPVEER